MTKHCKYDPKPGWNKHNAPDHVTETPDGSRLAIWFRPKSADSPEDYDYSVTHRGDVNWRVYFLLLCFLSVPVCALVSLVKNLMVEV